MVKNNDEKLNVTVIDLVPKSVAVFVTPTVSRSRTGVPYELDDCLP